MPTIKAFITKHAVAAYFALTFAISWGGVLAVAGLLVGHIFLNQALGAAYTPLSLGPDGRIYTENDGILFAVGQ